MTAHMEIEVRRELERVLRPGDILFTRLRNPMARKIADASACWTNHVGIAFRDPQRGWVVAESAVPLSRCGTLARFLRRSESSSICVRRFARGVTADEAAALWRAAQARLGRLYHTGFDYHASRQFCSKFVHDVYREAMGVEIGRKEMLRDLLQRNPDAPLNFWKLWYFGRIPWTRTTVTPASQYESPLLTTVYERLPTTGLSPARKVVTSCSHTGRKSEVPLHFSLPVTASAQTP